jgi:hypothetical protein
VVIATDSESEPDEHPRSDTEVAQRSAPTVQAKFRRQRRLTLHKRLILAALGLVLGLAAWALVSRHSAEPPTSDASEAQVVDQPRAEVVEAKTIDDESAVPAKLDIEDLSPTEAGEPARPKRVKPGQAKAKKKTQAHPTSPKPAKKKSSDVRDFGF